MPQIGNITVNDGQATPVSHTFNPTKIDSSGIAHYHDRSGGIAIGYPSISISLRTPTKNSRMFRAVKKTVVPVLEVTSPSTASGIQPQPTLAYNLTHIEEFILPERCTLAQRNDIIAYVANMQINAQWKPLIQNFESTY